MQRVLIAAALTAVVATGLARDASAVPVVFTFESKMSRFWECPGAPSVNGSCPEGGGDHLVPSSIPGISIGDAVTVRIFADNGGTTLFNQSWTQGSVFLGTVSVAEYRAVYFSGFFDFWSHPIWFATDSDGQISWVKFNGGESHGADIFGLGGEVHLYNGGFIDWFGRFADFEDGFSVLACCDPGQFDPRTRWTAAFVPEPGTLALLGVGLAALLLMRRRRRAV